MLTPRDAARLLSADGPLTALSAALGFATPVRLPPPERRALLSEAEVPEPVRNGGSRLSLELAAGAGDLRALLVDGVDDASRALALARSVVRRYPRPRWLLLVRSLARVTVICVPTAEVRGALPSLQLDPRHLRASDAESFAALAIVDADDALTHTRWRETLGRDALSRRFYRDLERAVDGLATTAIGRTRGEDRRVLALLVTSRLLFLAFLESKGWLNGDRAFLRHHMERLAGGRGLHVRMLDPLFFGTLNTPMPKRASAARAFGRVPFLNGGLFARGPLERRHRDLRFTDEAIAEVIGGLLAHYRLTARETSALVSDAAVDPEMLGRAFESLMAAPTRQSRGAFYTPHALIVHITDAALASCAADASREGATDRTLPRVIDPACGSGAFLVHVLESLSSRMQAAGDTRALGAIRRAVLTRCIFGVDVDPIAVWLCQLRLWLAVVVEEEYDDPMRLPPLPNLDRNVREGDSLAGDGFAGDAAGSGSALTAIRLRYARANGQRKRTLARLLDRAERGRAISQTNARLLSCLQARRELLIAARSPDLFATRRGVSAAQRPALLACRTEARRLRAELRRLREGGALPFAFATHFPEIAVRGGFDLVIGNPPWVRPHAVPVAMREQLRERFETARAAAWEAGAESAGAGRGFSSQVDLAALFTERSVQLLAPHGTVALLLPAKLWGALAGGGVRRYLLRECDLVSIDDWSASRTGFDAVVYPSAIVARRTLRGARKVQQPAAQAPLVRLTRHDVPQAVSWTSLADRLALDTSAGAPWLLLAPAARRAFDLLAAQGTALADSSLGRPLLGVKSGCNAAFVVRPVAVQGDDVLVRSGEREQLVEGTMLRPLARGEDLAPWRLHTGGRDAIVWTHDVHGGPVAELAPNTRRWLSRWRRELEARSDGRGARWWSLFRTEAARHDRARVVWADIGLTPRASVLPIGDPTVPLNTCYVVRTASDDDAHALAALLNSRIAGAWLAAIAEPARGGYRRFLGWTCARLPVPRDWPRARMRLAPVGRAAAAGAPPSADALDAVVAECFGLRVEALAALIEN